MIIRYSKSEREEIQAVTQAYDEKIDALFQSLFDNVPGKDIEAIKESMRELNRARAEASLNKRYELENRRFLKIASSPKKILEDAKRQTNAIIAELLKLVAKSKPISNEERRQQLKELDGKSDAELLDMIEPIPDILVDIFSEIEATRGEAARLNADQITKIIKKDLRRHYNRLSETARKELDAFVEDAVSEALASEETLPLPSKYFRMYHDGFIDAVSEISGNIMEENERTGECFINLHKTRISITDAEGLVFALGVPTHKLLATAMEQITARPSQNKAYIPTADYLQSIGYNVSDPEIFKKNIARTNKYLLTMQRMIITQAKEKGKRKRIVNKNIIIDTSIDNNFITVTFHPEYMKYLTNRNTQMQYPRALLGIDARSANAYRIGYKMAAHSSNYNNIIRGSENILAVSTLCGVTDLPSIETVKEQRNSWIRSIRDPLETALNTLVESGTITKWYYSKPKGKRMSPQERETARAKHETWIQSYICFTMKDAPDMTEAIEKNRERKRTAALKKEQEKAEKKT